MKEFNELKNGQSILDEVYEKFYILPINDIRKGICDALYAMNHFILLNEDKETEE